MLSVDFQRKNLSLNNKYPLPMPIYAYIVAHACMRSSIYIEAISKDDDVSSPMLSSSGWCICILLTKIFRGLWPIVD